MSLSCFFYVCHWFPFLFFYRPSALIHVHYHFIIFHDLYDVKCWFWSDLMTPFNNILSTDWNIINLFSFELLNAIICFLYSFYKLCHRSNMHLVSYKLLQHNIMRVSKMFFLYVYIKVLVVYVIGLLTHFYF